MPNRIEIPFPEIRSDFQGFTTLVNLSEQLNSLEYSTIALNMSSMVWVDANMRAPLGAILYKASRALNSDFNDQILVRLCNAKRLQLVTHDFDFKGKGINILTANPRIL